MSPPVSGQKSKVYSKVASCAENTLVGKMHTWERRTQMYVDVLFVHNDVHTPESPRAAVI